MLPNIYKLLKPSTITTLTFLWTLSFITVNGGGFSSSAEERRLLEFIATKLTRYSPHGEMVNHTVYPTVSLFQILDVDEPSEAIIIRVSLSMYYLIPSLVWSERDFNGTTIMTFPSKSFWRPDFVSANVFNVIDKTDRGQAVFGETGMVVAVSEAMTVACACDLDISHFPFDSHCCRINLAQWLTKAHKSPSLRSKFSPSYKFDVNEGDYLAGNVEINEYRDHDQWTLKTPVFYKILTHNKSKDGWQYQSLDMTLCFKRIYHFWYIVLVLPALILYILSCFVFLLPAESGEKISFGVTILLSELVILGTSNMVMPKSSSDIPIFGKLVAVAISNMGISILLTLFVLTVDITPSKQPMPPVAKKLMEYSSLFSFCKSNQSQSRYSSEASSTVPGGSPISPKEVTKPALTQQEVDLIARLGLQLAKRIKKRYLEKEEVDNPWPDLAKLLDQIFFVIYSSVAIFVIVFFHVWMES